ncbi:MAG: hypothetical protein K2G90_05780, partial [Muribaculaceae bacterium]|nr:hypothetical protein [Muribaculaceae bacterium]
MKLTIFKIFIIIAVMLTITGITGCGSARKDKRLVQVSNQIADSLSRAEDLLKEIDRNHLSASDRH